MKSIIIFSLFFLIFIQFSCVRKCKPITGPEEIDYKILSNPSCFEKYEEISKLINSEDDYKTLCPGEVPSALWDFENKTYIIITACNTAKEPYLAGIGNDPTNNNQILVTIGLPCNYGATPAILVCKTFTIEIFKTSKTLRVDIKNESY